MYHRRCFLGIVITCLGTLAAPWPPVSALAQQINVSVEPFKKPVLDPREQINSQLAANQKCTVQLYELLDGVEPGDAESSRMLESQLEALDRHNEVLYDELDRLDREQYISDRRSDLMARVQTLRAQAKQLRRQKRDLPAAGLDARAVALQVSLDDGTWLRWIDQQWKGSVEPTVELPEPEYVQALRNEIAGLRAETDQLRRELGLLRGIVQRLTVGPRGKEE